MLGDRTDVHHCNIVSSLFRSRLVVKCCGAAFFEWYSPLLMLSSLVMAFTVDRIKVYKVVQFYSNYNCGISFTFTSCKYKPKYRYTFITLETVMLVKLCFKLRLKFLIYTLYLIDFVRGKEVMNNKQVLIP